MATRPTASTDVEELVPADTFADSRPAAVTPVAAVATSAPMDVTYQPPMMALQVWLLTSGRKPDQTAGFQLYASGRGFGPRTAADWEGAYGEFLARVV